MNVIEAAKDMLKDRPLELEDAGVSPIGRGLRHVKWMLEEIIKGEMSEGKANRWLGYAQGVYVSMCYSTLNEMKNINKINS